jgi:glycosyltransferase involved in cell wall biosynthesis
MSNKKILIATGVYPPESGGPATYSKLIEERLPALGFEVRVLPFRSVRHLPKLIRHVAYFLKVLFIRADIIYAQDTVSVGLPAALAALVSRRKLVVRVPGDYAWEQGRQRFGVKDELDDFQQKRYGLSVGLLRAIQRFVLNCARAIVVPSQYMKGIVRKWRLRPEISVIYSSIDIPRPSVVNRPEGFLIVTIARPVPWKGLEGLKRVVAREENWHLEMVNDLPHAEAMGWLKAADVFVLNSTYEGLSHALIEAMMLGTPVIATNVGGNPELVEDGVTGLLINPKDDESLYAALKKVEQDRKAAQARGEVARVKSSAFSINRTIGEIAKLLNSL